VAEARFPNKLEKTSASVVEGIKRPPKERENARKALNILN